MDLHHTCAGMSRSSTWTWHSSVANSAWVTLVQRLKKRGKPGASNGAAVENSVSSCDVREKDDEIFRFCSGDHHGLQGDVETVHNGLPHLIGGDQGSSTPNRGEESVAEISLCLNNGRRAINDTEKPITRGRTSSETSKHIQAGSSTCGGAGRQAPPQEEHANVDDRVDAEEERDSGLA
jgi:hypothetical protein